MSELERLKSENDTLRRLISIVVDAMSMDDEGLTIDRIAIDRYDPRKTLKIDGPRPSDGAVVLTLERGR